MKDIAQDNIAQTEHSSGEICAAEDSMSLHSGRNSWNPFVRERGLRRYIGPKRIMLGFLFFTLVGVVWYLRQLGYVNPEVVFILIAEKPLMAPLIFIACYALSVMLMIPSLPLNLSAGFLWGPVWGTLVAASGSCLGAIGAFLLGRIIMGQPLAKRFDNRVAKWLQGQLNTKGWKIVAFTRINPIIPSGPLNFAFGLTSIDFFSYAWSSFVFLIPPTLAFAIIGYEVGDFVIKGNIADLIRIVFIVSGVITLMVLIKVGAKNLIVNKRKGSE